jgi:hypothetical protein
MIDEGTYRARGVEGELSYAETGNEQVAVLFAITEEGFEHQMITWYGYFTDKTEESTLKALHTMGWEGDDLSDLTGIDRNEVYLVIVHEEGQDGQTRARVRWVNATPGRLALKNRMDEGQKAAFAERMRGKVLAQKARMAGSPAAANNQAAQPSARKPAAAAANSSAKGAATSGGKVKDDDQIPF